MNLIVVSSTLDIEPNPSPLARNGGGPAVRSVFMMTFSYCHMKSSALKSSPSDHFMPSLRKNVHSLPSSLTSHPLATEGTNENPSVAYRTRDALDNLKKLHPSAGPM